MSFASDFRAAIRAESTEEIRRMAGGGGMLAAIASEELARRERERLSAEQMTNTPQTED